MQADLKYVIRLHQYESEEKRERGEKKWPASYTQASECEYSEPEKNNIISAHSVVELYTKVTVSIQWICI